MKTNLLIISLILCGSPWQIRSQPIAPEDIIIVEIHKKEIDLKRNDANQKYQTQAQIEMKALSDFLAQAIPLAKFIVIDMWVPSSLEGPGEQELLKQIQTTRRITMAAGNRNEKELTDPKFFQAMPELGHFHSKSFDSNTKSFPTVLCINSSFAWVPVEDCAESDKYRHISLIAAEGFLGYKLDYAVTDVFDIKRKDFLRLRRMNFTEFKKDPAKIQNKLVIVQTKSAPSVNWFRMIGKKRFTGAELIGNAILMFSKLPRKK